MSKLLANFCGVAHSGGIKHWWRQRLTAVALIPLVIWFTIYSAIMVKGDLLANEYFILYG